MEGKGILVGAAKNYRTGKMDVTFEMDSDITGELDAILEKPLRITAKLWREHRSLNANAYYFALLAKLAEAMHISKTRAHNLMLRRYGQDFILDGCLAYIVVPDTDEAEETALESETFHIKPTSEVRPGKDGRNYRTYKLLRGSHEYDTKEMSELIDGLVSEAKELGIETLPPQELEEMMRAYERQYSAKR